MKRENQGRLNSVPASEAERQVLVDALASALVKALQEDPAAGRQKQSSSGNDRSSIDMVELFYHVLARIKYVIAAALIGALLLGMYAFLFVTPVYEATSKLYIMSQDDVAVSLSDLQIGALLTMDYQEVFKTWEVHEMVREELRLDYSYKDMQSMLKVSNPDDTRLLYITVTHEDPQAATDIANAYAKAAKEFILQTMETKEPNVFSIALVPSIATGMSKTRFVLVGFVLGTVLSLCIIFMFFILDDRPRTPEDISRAAGIPTLAIVPEEDEILPQKRKRASGGRKNY